MKLAVLIQARMGATRFPGKVLAPLAEKPVLSHLIDACDRAAMRKVVYVLPPFGRAEDPIRAYCQRIGVRTIDTPSDITPNDVLSRFINAAAVIGLVSTDTVVRLTADCPLLDHRVLVDLVQSFDHRRHYAAQVNAPDGTDVEVFTYQALREAHQTAHGSDREHVTPSIQRKAGFIAPKSDPATKFSVDTIDDLRRCDDLLLEVGHGKDWRAYVDHLKAKPAPKAKS